MNKIIQNTCCYVSKDPWPLTAQRTSAFLDTTTGRDKFYRLIQYIVKFILPFIKDKKQFLRLSLILENFGGACGMARKV
jgi:hypothetical protein